MKISGVGGGILARMRLASRPMAWAATLFILSQAALADPQPVKQAQRVPVLAADAAQQPKTIVLKRFVSRPSDAIVGELSRGWLCAGSVPVRFTSNTVQLVSRGFGRAFRQRLEQAGYPLPSAEARSAFDSPDTARRAGTDFELGVTLKDMQANLCDKGSGESMGGVWLDLRWEVFSPSAQKVVLDVSTQGSYQLLKAEKATAAEMFDRAFGAAVDNLFAQQAYFDLLHGKTAVVAAAPATLLRLKGGADAAMAIEQAYDTLASATVTLGDGTSAGTGFYVSDDGYILTNQHVVGDQRYMKARLRDGRELVGEVVRVSRSRDVALIKTSPPGVIPLYLRKMRGAQTGEEVYVIGSPLGRTFSGTLTRGILSGHRTIDGMSYLQSDAKVLPGNSGGPLLDAQGRVIGLTRMIVGANVAGGGINLFVPISDALASLTLEVE